MIRRRMLLGSVVAAPALAQTAGFPDHPLRLIIPFPPGGGTDAFARRIATRLGQELGQNVVPENRTGASGAIGVLEVLRSRADGYTLVFGGASTHALYPLVVAKPQYEPLVDFAPVALVGANTVCFVTRPEVAADLPALVEEARRRPGQLRIGSPGTGTYVHMVGEYLRYAAGRLQMLHVPYRGNGPAMIDLLAGNLDCVSDTVVTSLPHHKEGRVRMVAVASRARSPLAPEVPTVIEAINLPDFEAALWNLLLVKAGTPAPLVATLHAACQRALADEAFQAELKAAGIEPSPAASPEEAAGFMRRETERWRPIVAATGVRLD